MTSNRPYLLRALNEWINDNGMTPYLLVDAAREGVQVPASVIKELVENAIDADATRITILQEFGGKKLISVEDNGIGISQENLDKIWQRFYQADPSRQENAGLGLGLSMVQQIVTLHGGAVAVTSAPGHGTTFTVTLPEHHGKEES